MKRLWKERHKKEGSFALLFVILCFIAVLVITGFIDILRQSHLMNESQSVMDVASITALRAGVDEERLRVEELVVDEGVVISGYKKAVKETMESYGDVLDVRFVKTKTEVYKEKWGTGVTGKERDQVLLDSTIILTVKSSIVFDTLPMLADRYYDARSNEEFYVTYLGQDEDGRMEISIRSVSRLVYR